MHVSQLTDDFLSTTGKFQRIFVNQVLEAPAIFKHDGKYFFVGSHCTGWAPNPAVSAMADSIFGPWRVLEIPHEDPAKTSRSDRRALTCFPSQASQENSYSSRIVGIPKMRPMGATYGYPSSLKVTAS
jgi:hypothetical protein